MKRTLISGGIMLGLGMSALSYAGIVDPELRAVIEDTRPNQDIDVIIEFSNKFNLHTLKHKKRGAKRHEEMVRGLRKHSEIEQSDVKELLAGHRIHQHKQLWLNNSLAVSVPARMIDEIAESRRVSRVRLDKKIAIQAAAAGSPAPAEWNIQAVHANDVWAQGITGQGIVVGSMDTGVDAAHADLSSRWRGGANSWFDPYGQHATPYDTSGHGTQTTSLIVGGDANGTSIGVAPGAQWIAAKIFNDSDTASMSAIHASFQWMLDPDGNPATDDGADIVNNSWDLSGSINLCDAEFQADINALRAAGVAVVFSAGNYGPNSSTSVSPANNAGALAVGAVDEFLTIAFSSSRGPSACSGNIFPQLVAPGMNVLAADLTFGGIIPLNYMYVSGTSFSAPHVAGALALLQSAFPNSTLDERETALIQTAVDMGTVVGADNDYGYGLVDINAAYAQLGGTPPPPTIGSAPVAANDSASTTENTAVTINLIANDIDADGTIVGGSLTFVTQPAHGTAMNNGNGTVTYTPTANFNGSDSFSYTVKDNDGNLSNKASVDITVNAVNNPPVANNESYAMTSDTKLSVAAPGVLGNDTDIDSAALTAVLQSGTAHGSLTLNANGSFSYTPNVGWSGTDSFSYVANDGAANSNIATVTITVNAPTPPPTSNVAPLANDDTAVAKKNSRRTSYTVTFSLTANDSDKDGNLNPASVAIIANPVKGSLINNGDGSVTYQAFAGKSGRDTFEYTVSDTLGATSNIATVTITIK